MQEHSTISASFPLVEFAEMYFTSDSKDVGGENKEKMVVWGMERV